MTIPQTFRLLESEQVSELAASTDIYEHIPTGAKLLKLQIPDENYTFGVSFNTLPYDSTGVAHILEHSVLCGSQKYPVKEVFVEVLRNSLQTYLNAWTFPDKTVYPLATPHPLDFLHLISVYLDTVFRPLLLPEVFAQEGWHYELNEAGKLIQTGVVLNEMKGVYSSAAGVEGELVLHNLFPGSPYAHDSGGNPEIIPELTYEKFLQFHRQHYVPANAKFFLSGSGDLLPAMELIDNYLNDMTPGEKIESVKLFNGIPYPGMVSAKFPLSQTGQDLVSITWDLGDRYSPLEMDIITYLLLGEDVGCLYKVLMDSGMVGSVSGGMETELRQYFFSVQLNNTTVENSQKLVQLVMDTLSRVDELVTREQVEAAINTIEFDRREIFNSSSVPGITLLRWSFEAWNYDKSPISRLRFAKDLKQAKEKFLKKEYLHNWVTEFLINNHRRLVANVAADPDLAVSLEKQSTEKLVTLWKQMTPAEQSAVKNSQAALADWQSSSDEPEKLALIPRLQVADLPRKVKKISVEALTPQQLRLQTPTQGITYVNALWDLGEIDVGNVQAVELLADSLPRLGTNSKTHTQLAIEIDTHTGGMSTGTRSYLPRSSSLPIWKLRLTGRATHAKLKHLVDLGEELLQDPNLDQPERFRRLLGEYIADTEMGILHHGDQYAAMSAAAGLHPHHLLLEKVGGTDYLRFLRSALKNWDDEWPMLHEVMKRSMAVIHSEPFIALTTDGEEKISELLKPWTQKTQFQASKPLQMQSRPTSQQWRAQTIPGYVSFVAMAGDLANVGYTYRGSMMAITELINKLYLWQQVRIQGGAYGAWFGHDNFSGVFTMASYRDPRLDETVENMFGLSEFLLNHRFTKEEIAGAIIAAVGSLDRPMGPEQRGLRAVGWHFTGIDDELRQQWRNELLATSVDDIHELGEYMQSALESVHVCTLSPANMLERSKLPFDEQEVLL